MNLLDMGKSKPRAKKSKRGVDFKKIKRKVGRKLPPPKNFTDTSIKSKAIILPEQSIATEKVGLAVDRKGLTLRELFQQTSHHNARTRKAALLGIKDLMLKHPLELKLHKFAIVEKLRERICDNDKVVRETLYQILKCVVFPCLMEELTRPIMSLLLAYVFNAMTHMAADIRLMAFKFFELIVLNYPSSFTLHTQQVFDNYIDILRNYQIYLQDRSNLKNALAGLERCLSFLVGKARECDRRSVLDFDERRCLHSYTSEAQNDFADIFLAVNKFEDLVPALVNCFQESILLFRGMSKNDALSFDCLLCTVGCINHSVELFVATTNKFLGCHGHVSQTDGEPDVVKIDMLGLLKKLWESFPISQPHNVGEKEDERYFILNVKITETFLHLFQWIDDNTFPIEKFLRFIECFLLGKVDCGALNKSLLEKNLSTVLPFFPRFISQSIRSWRVPLLKAFTLAFMDCKVDSPACLLYLNAIEEMILPTSSCSMLLCSDPEVLCFLVDWIHKLPKILQSVGDRHTNISEAVLKLILSIGQSSMLNSLLALEFDHIQLLLKEFYVIRRVEDAITYGPFLKLPLDCQELAICCLYYFSSLSIDLLESLCSCCLNPSMDVFIVIVW
ncbi:hypothetical protein HPP92_005522 [Vanilla planifolia]|uniref:Pre-rRNA-processing protein Ipi1 N-terminal domain-containing protein n=1 Tax=Vanilla planifolia TaxID=51239 RepID=A0A835VES3_VANPL|nr:hypothetical protein HPP92_005522 [Vanilla planifolia]